MGKESTLLASRWTEKLVERSKDLHSQVARNKEKRAFETRVIEQVAEILTGVTSVEQITEIEKAIQVAKGKLQVEQRKGFWEGKTPCWEMFRCPEDLKRECPAFNNRSQPCWEMEGTYCKLSDNTEKREDIDICQYCRVYKRWGDGEPIGIKVRENGILANS